mgnify:CR=1 FL=1
MQLEEELGVKLFHRSKHSIILTEDKMADLRKIYPRTGDTQTVYLKMWLRTPISRLEIIRCIMIFACGAWFLFNSALHLKLVIIDVGGVDNIMEIRVLKYFLMVAREENITKAAALLHLTQPTLSRQLMQLEEELGVKLFHFILNFSIS